MRVGPPHWLSSVLSLDPYFSELGLRVSYGLFELFLKRIHITTHEDSKFVVWLHFCPQLQAVAERFARGRLG